MPKNPDPKADDDQKLRRRLCDDVLGGVERWHTDSDKRRAKRYYFETSANVQADESEISGFLQWYVHDFRDAATGRTLMEHHLETHGAQLTPREREILEALRDSWPGMFEVEATEEGRGVHLRDLATGDTIFVHDITASRELVRGDWILSRIEDLDGKLMFVSDGFTVPPAVRGEVLKLFDKEARALGQTRVEYVRRSGNRLYRKIRDLSDKWVQNLRVVNREGDAVEFCRADYSVLDEVALLGKLRLLAELMEEPGTPGEAPLRVARSRHRGSARRLRPCTDRRRPPASGSAIPHAPPTGPRIARDIRRPPAETPGRCVPVTRRNQAADGRFRRTGKARQADPGGTRTRVDTPDEGESLRQVARRPAPRVGRQNRAPGGENPVRPESRAGPDPRHGTPRGSGSQGGRSRLRFHPAAQNSGAGRGVILVGQASWPVIWLNFLSQFRSGRRINGCAARGNRAQPDRSRGRRRQPYRRLGGSAVQEALRPHCRDAHPADRRPRPRGGNRLGRIPELVPAAGAAEIGRASCRERV